MSLPFSFALLVVLICKWLYDQCCEKYGVLSKNVQGSNKQPVIKLLSTVLSENFYIKNIPLEEGKNCKHDLCQQLSTFIGNILHNIA